MTDFYRQLSGDIAATVEEHGSAQLKTSAGFAEQLQRRYDGFRRDSAIESLTILDPQDELYGWGFYLHHCVSITPIDPTPVIDEKLTGRAFQRATRIARQEQKVWFRVRITPEPQPTVAMLIVRATTQPLVLANTDIYKIRQRIARLLTQNIPVDFAEKLRELRVEECATGVRVGRMPFRIEPIPPEDS